MIRIVGSFVHRCLGVNDVILLQWVVHYLSFYSLRKFQLHVHETTDSLEWVHRLDGGSQFSPSDLT